MPQETIRSAPNPASPSSTSSTNHITTAMSLLTTDSSASSLPTTTSSTVTPSLPPSMTKSTAEHLASLNSHPLFMTTLEENDDVEALKALAYEGTPSEIASGFKERGNESFKEKSWVDAKEFYTKGILVLLTEIRKRQSQSSYADEEDGKGEDEKEEVRKELSILEASLINRAACHLELKNYRSCIQDCGAAIRLNARNVKAYYRSSKALLALSRIREADDACSRGLELDGGNLALQGVAKEIIRKNEEVEEKIRKERGREARRVLEVKMLQAALKARNIKTRQTAQPPEMEDAKITLVPDPTSPESTLVFPTVLLYPLAMESDFVKAFGELECLADHLAYILPPPWDEKGEYATEGVECYMETEKGGLIKIGKKVALLKVLGGGSVEVVDGVVRVYVLPKWKAAEWVKEFKERKKVERGG